jgi:nucleotide-binding universal stress UspA family protein
MFRKILVPLDGSARAEDALAFALALAQKAGSELLLLRVPDPDLQDALVPAILEQDAQWQEADASNLAILYLDRLIQKYAHLELALEAIVQEGDAASVILDLAAAEAVDLVVMAPRGLSGLSRWVFGSVTERVLRRAACPVLVARVPEPSPALVVTLDGSAVAEQALPVALALAELHSCPITLLRVEPPNGYEALTATGYVWEDADDPKTELLQTAGYAPSVEYLDRVATEIGPKDQIVQRALLLGSPAERILDYAERMSSGLLVMASHGRTGLQRWVYGSVTEKVLHGTDRSLVVVRSRLGRDPEETPG